MVALYKSNHRAPEFQRAVEGALFVYREQIGTGLNTHTYLACSRLSDSGEDAKEKGTRYPQFPPFFLISCLRFLSGPDYLGAWNRLTLIRKG